MERWPSAHGRSRGQARYLDGAERGCESQADDQLGRSKREASKRKRRRRQLLLPDSFPWMLALRSVAQLSTRAARPYSHLARPLPALQRLRPTSPSSSSSSPHLLPTMTGGLHGIIDKITHHHSRPASTDGSRPTSPVASSRKSLDSSKTPGVAGSTHSTDSTPRLKCVFAVFTLGLSERR